MAIPTARGATIVPRHERSNYRVSVRRVVRWCRRNPHVRERFSVTDAPPAPDVPDRTDAELARLLRLRRVVQEEAMRIRHLFGAGLITLSTCVTADPVLA